MQSIHYITAINLATDFSTLILCLLGGVILLGGPTINQRDKGYWLLFFVCLMIFTLSNLTGQFLRGAEGSAVRGTLYITNYLEFTLSGILIFIVAIHLLNIVDTERYQTLMAWILRAAVAVHVMMITISQFTGWFYEIDEMNYYHRNSLYPLTYLMPLGFILFILYLVVRYRQRLSRRERIAYTIYSIVPLLAGIAQIFIYGVYLIVFSMGVAALVLITFIVLDQTEHYYKQKQENTALKTDILIAQIRPQFLYNSLLVIQQVCLQDPRKASDAIGDFLRYLRHNMESISKETLIPFREELNHVRHYVSLQQLRFGDDLKVEYDLACEFFMMPALTLQPLVENAVRYGVRKNESGQGTVLITTRETVRYFEVAVIDDGPGFDPKLIEQGARPDEEAKDESHAGIGLVNVRRRLAMLCDGKLEIDSQPGKGTKVTILLPKDTQDGSARQKKKGRGDADLYSGR